MSTANSTRKIGSPPGKGKQVDQNATEPKYYINRVFFSQRAGPDHQGIVLVDSETSDQGRGILVHVIGNVGLGMDYQVRQGYNFLASRSYKSHHLVGVMPKSKRGDFMAVAQSIKPPHDPDVMFGKKAPAEDCSTWINKLLQHTQHLRS